MCHLATFIGMNMAPASNAISSSPYTSMTWPVLLFLVFISLVLLVSLSHFHGCISSLLSPTTFPNKISLLHFLPLSSPSIPPSAYCSDLLSLSVRKAKQAGREWDLFSYPLHPVSPLPPLALLLVPWQVQHSIEINHLPRQIHVCMCVRELVRRVRAPSWWWCVFCCEHGPRTTTLLLPACVRVCVYY